MGISDQNLSLQEYKRKLTQINKKKQELERRLGILMRAKPTNTISIEDEPRWSFYTGTYEPKNIIESEIQNIMN